MSSQQNRKAAGGPARPAAVSKPSTPSTTPPAETPPEPTLPEIETQEDPRDAELSALRAELAAAQEAKRSEDPRDAAIAALRAELAELRSTPQGAESELQKAFAALRADMDRMQKGQGLVPVPVQTDPDPYLYHARLANGDVIELQHPNVTHWHVEGLGPVPVESVWNKAPEEHLVNA